MSNMSERRVLVMPRSRRLRGLAAALVFVALGIWLISDTSTVEVVVGWAAIAFFGVLGVPVIVAQLVRAPRLELDADGFCLVQPVRAARRSWSECSPFELVARGRRGRPMIVYRTTRTDHRALRRVNTALATGDEAIEVGYGGLSAPELVHLLNSYRQV